MKTLVFIALAAIGVQAGSRAADAPMRQDRDTVVKAVDNRFQDLFPDYPVEILGVTQMVYIKGYGAVLSGELNLAPGSNITPFHPTISKQDVERTRTKKAERIPALREAMQQLLISSAKSLTNVPDNEEVVLGVSLFYWHWEDRAGLPDQIVMHAPKKMLLAASKAPIPGLKVDEF